MVIYVTASVREVCDSGVISITKEVIQMTQSYKNKFRKLGRATKKVSTINLYLEYTENSYNSNSPILKWANI